MVGRLNDGSLEDPAGLGPKTDPLTRPMRGLANPMIYLNLSHVMEDCDPENRRSYREQAAASAESIVTYHLKPELRCTLETTGPGGEFYRDASSARVVNPGHDIECSWFLLEEARRSQKPSLKAAARQVFDFAVEGGWDKEYGGLLYFTDALGSPVEACEQDMKLWWPHNELAIASLMFYEETGGNQYLSCFIKNMEYCKKHFADPEFGEWYGYLRRDGVPSRGGVKGTAFKGPFHLPRMLKICDRLLSRVTGEKG
jgi:N-acylglucosamine 2-epimerase